MFYSCVLVPRVPYLLITLLSLSILLILPDGTKYTNYNMLRVPPQCVSLFKVHMDLSLSVNINRKTSN